jgi:uncharacterized protein YjbJ (UPF0337 family)
MPLELETKGRAEYIIANFSRSGGLEEEFMDKDRVGGSAKEIKGAVKQVAGKATGDAKVKDKWGELTDDDIAAINGNREQLERKIRKLYGHGNDQVMRDVARPRHRIAHGIS